MDHGRPGRQQRRRHPIELKLPIQWTGDTPVLALTDYHILGMGPFNVRLMFHDGQYAGTWSSRRHGGLRWGKIEP